MLTKNLVRHRTRGERIFPVLIDPENRELLDSAAALIEIFEGHLGETRETLANAVQEQIEAGAPANLVLKGFEKLLLDRCEFGESAAEELVGLREKVFQESSILLKSPDAFSLDAYLQRISGKLDEDLQAIRDRLYADLPECQPLRRFKTITPERFLHRYNCAQVQGLLLHSQRVSIALGKSSAGAYRQLFKYLRFQRLLADILPLPGGGIRIEIDGPLSLFYQTQKYGLNLAAFFPGLLHQERWSLEAEVRFKGRKSVQLQLDQDCGIRPYSGRYLDYVPPEIALLEESFNEKTEDWSLSAGGHFIPLAGDRYCFPDFVLRHARGGEWGIELFHPWHASHLQARLAQLAGVGQPPLLLGVSTRLIKDPETAALLENSPYFSLYGFTFRDIPAVGKIKPLLEHLLAALP
ncbi:MAG TPA: DUF790 family protein [Calditrichia bacterium]|nr:DUF790 family protein [Calditrichia bacterium]HQV30223.1 DUF790 family protein [Calditrichia bacterium]